MQCAMINYFRMCHRGKIIFHIPNGEHRDAVTGARLKRAGVLAGVPDLCIPYANNDHTHLYVEVKTSKGRPSDKQIAVIKELQEGGARVEIVRSVKEFIDLVEEYFNNK